MTALSHTHQSHTLERLKHRRRKRLARLEFTIGALFFPQVLFDLLRMLQNEGKYAVNLRQRAD